MSTAPMITANLMVPSVLSNWAQQNLGRTLATADEWCYIANNSIPASAGSCGGSLGLAWLGVNGANALLIACGMSPDGSNRANLPQITADQFVSALLAVQQQAASATQGPGGSSTGTSNPAPGTSSGGSGPAAGTGTTQPGQGVLGLTNCSFCQTVAKNPLLLLIIAVAVYFLFFDD